ncbi:MAG TPA: tetratricopeptide repeat protein [Steroidobacteraceae bacterium]|nr:tetratricopeptide repeat protein [Steroidobacteraceae bacterium]
MVLLILPYIIQALLIVHVIKTGRNFLWIWVLLLLPFGIGALVYLAVEVLPELFRSRAARRASRGVRRALDPGGDLRRYENEVRVAGNVASRQRYAEELVRHQRYDEAIAQYTQALSGLYEHDPNLMLGLAQAQFAKGEPSAARATLDELIRLNPEFRSPAGHLLYARALAAEGNVAKALEEYRVLSPSYPGAEAAVRYAQLLDAQGEREAARQVARELIEQARIAPGHYRRAQREWLEAAQRLL